MTRPGLFVRLLLTLAAPAAPLVACGAASSVAQETPVVSHQARDPLVDALTELAARTNGSLGACITSERGTSCVNGDRAYSMQSVMKLLVALVTFDAVERGLLRLDEPVLVRREDLSLYVQPIARLVGDAGYRTKVEDLIRRAVVDSDSAATDILIRRLGGTAAVQSVLRRMRIEDIRIDRNERDLQTEIVGLTWRPEYTDASTLQRAIAAVPQEQRRVAHQRYLSDPRDTATPRGMAQLLHRLARGELLPQASTERLLAILRETRTFPSRLRAGAPEGWAVGHKTGSSGSFQGHVAATNDVGLYFPPDAAPIAIAVFLGDSSAAGGERDAAIAAVGRLAVADFRRRAGMLP
jgi:beta-lactamase class A